MKTVTDLRPETDAGSVDLIHREGLPHTMSGPRVVHLITSLESGGAERMLARLVEHETLADDHVEHIVVSLKPGGVFEQRIRAAGVSHHCIGMRPNRPTIAALIRTVRLLRSMQPVLLMSWLYHADLLATLAHPWSGRPRLIWNIRGTAKDATEIRRSLRAVVWCLARLSSYPWAIGVNSYAGRKDHEELGYRPTRWAYLPNGFSATAWKPDTRDRLDVRRELGFVDSDVVLVMAARTDPQKDHATLLKAAERALGHDPSRQLLLLGRGVESLPVPKTIRGQVHLLGERDDVPRILRGCDVGVLSSSYGEGLPNAVGEAMLTALPCVVTDVGDASRLVGDTGIVVPPQDPVALAGAIADMAARPWPDREAMGRAARERVVEHYSLDAAIQAYRRLWADL